jgi:hypothetical protein
MSTFNADTFLGMETDAPMETHFQPVPEGEYNAMIDTVVAKEVNDSPVLDVTYILLDEDLKKSMNMDRVSVRQSLFIDVESDGRIALGPNKNVKLGKLRDALDQNSGTWTPRMLIGAGPLTVKTKNTPDKNDPENVYSNVVRTAPAQ